MSGLRLDYAVPGESLAEYFSLFYDFGADMGVFDEIERADRAQLRMRISPGPTAYRFADGTSQAAPRFHIVGPTTGAFRASAEGPVDVFGAGVTPAGWAALIGTDASTATDRVIDAAELFDLADAEVQGAIARIGEVAGITARVARAEPLLRALIRRGARANLEFVEQVDAWLADSPSPDIAELVRACRLSRRQVERRCNALYGAPPKLLARKYRALRAGVALMAGGETLEDAIARGFYDQSHLIRELKQFTGLTPRQLHDHPGPLARLTVDGRIALGGRVGPLVSGT